MTFLASQKITAATEIENCTEYNIQNTRIITKSTWRLQTTAGAADLRKFLRLVVIFPVVILFNNSRIWIEIFDQHQNQTVHC